MTLLRRLIALSLTLFAVLFSTSAAGVATPPVDGHVGGYTYDVNHHPAHPTYTVSERGPPALRNYTTSAYDAVDHRSDGVSARLSGRTITSVTTYGHPAPRVQVARAMTTTGGHVVLTDEDLSSDQPLDVAAKSASGAESSLSGALLRTHLRQLEKYGQGGFRELESGRFRYYGNLSGAAKEGEMAGRRLVREWDPATGYTRTWHETIDQAGNVRIVRPETGGPKTHYYFDEFGNYGGAW